MIDESRFSDEEKIINGVQELVADFELVRGQTIDAHVANTKTHDGSGNFVLL